MPLGGVGEFGRNVLWLKCGASSILVDVGVSFPDESFPGIDRIAPDLSVLRGERIDGVFLTHGHEDHVGALSFLREWCQAPVYGFPFTLALARRRLEEARAPLDRMIEARGREPIQAGAFTVTFFRVSHSVPGSSAVLVEAGGRRLIHSGDFKLDDDPPDGETTDREGIAAAVGEGVDLALVDSTNAERPGRSQSERVAGEGLRAAFQGARGRIILTTFSSHVARVSQAAEAALAAGRRVALLGRSMRAVAEIAERFGRLRLPAGSRPAANDLRGIPPGRLLCLTSGSQGEPFSALYRLALGEHADLELAEGDLVLLSARTIPGHERSVNRMSDHLVRRGARVVRETVPPIHVSGHAHRDEIAEWIRMVRPRAVMPVHGDRRMLAAAGEIAVAEGDRARARAPAGQRRPPEPRPGRRDHRPESRRPAAWSTSTAAPRRWGRRSCASGVTWPRRASSSSSSGATRWTSSPAASRPTKRSSRARSRARPAPCSPARASEERGDPEWLRAEIAIAAKRACRRALDLRPVIVPVVV